MKRVFSFNISTIFWGFLLLTLITLTLSLIKQAFAYMRGNFYGISFSTLLYTALIVLFILVFIIITRFMKGDFGEMYVAYILDKLKDYDHVSDVVITKNKGNIDNVVVGKNGVWTVESKYQTEKIIIHDKFLDEKIKQAYAESLSVQDFLKQNGIFTPVTPILVFANKKSILHFGERPVNGVYIIGITWLQKLLTERESGELSPEQCQQILQLLKTKNSTIN